MSGGMPGESNVQAPKTATTVITSDDIEPPTEITNPKLRKKIKATGEASAPSTAAEGTETEGDADEDPDATMADRLESGVSVNSYQVTECTLVRDLLGSCDHSNLIDGPDFGTQPAVDTENLAIDNCGQHKKVENVAAGFPD